MEIGNFHPQSFGRNKPWKLGREWYGSDSKLIDRYPIIASPAPGLETQSGLKAQAPNQSWIIWVQLEGQPWNIEHTSCSKDRNPLRAENPT